MLSSKRILNKPTHRFCTSTSKMGKGKQLAESSKLFEPCVIVHGGAWYVPIQFKELSAEGVQAAARTGYRTLLQGGSAVDGVEAAVKSLEDNPVFNAGYGSVLTEDGTVEMDAMIMDGKTLNTGGVASVPSVANPVGLARLVMEKTSHCLLVADGAVKFAKKQNVPILEDPTVLVSKWSKLKTGLVNKSTKPDFDSMVAATMNTESLSSNQDKSLNVIEQRLSQENMHDTVGAVAMDCHGNIACATSTGGIPFKMVGRVGDSPLAGSGGYANSIAGVSTTGHGESIIKTVLAYEVATQIENGSSPSQACANGIKKMYDLTKGQGGIICIDKSGDFGKAFTTGAMSWASLKGGILSHGVYPGEMEQKQDFLE
ncbi:hypothetical protein QZH41_008200 [Actinostola sp. cb2023]|nr:hypothetical protein QZH41_008200 [Actinostola sp. cb2023]